MLSASVILIFLPISKGKGEEGLGEREVARGIFVVEEGAGVTRRVIREGGGIAIVTIEEEVLVGEGRGIAVTTVGSAKAEVGGKKGKEVRLRGN
jgi:hypothetical protein